MNYMKQMNRFQGFFFIVKIGFSLWERHRNWFEELARVLADRLSEFLSFDQLGPQGLQREFQRH